jgi:hypothetical protein
MEKTILADSEVLGELQKFIRVILYTDSDQEPWRSNREDIKQPMTGQGTNPLYVVLAPDGETVLDVIGYTRSKQDFLEFLSAGADYFQ